MRILITGSRKWTDEAAIRDVLQRLHRLRMGPYTLVHGDAKGADRIAAQIASQLGWTVEAHPADWQGPCDPQCEHGPRKRRPDGVEYCPAAGLHRNRLMIELGANLCVAFIKDRSRGATMCAEAAQSAKIRVAWFTE